MVVCIEWNITVDNLDMQNVTKQITLKCSISFREWTVVIMFSAWWICVQHMWSLRSLCDLETLCGISEWPSCVHDVCVCVGLATGCESVTVPSVIQAFQLRSALINHLPRHPAAFPLRHHSSSVPQKNSPKRSTLSPAIQVSQ